MATVLALAVLCSLLASVVGLLKPSLVLRTENPTRLKAFGLYFGISIACTMAFNVVSPAKKTPDTITNQSASTAGSSGQTPAQAPAPSAEPQREPEEPAPAPLPPASMNMKIEEFHKNFNKTAKKLKFNHKLPALKIEKGEDRDTGQAMLTDVVGFLVTADQKTRRVREVMLMSAPGGNANAAMDTISCMITLIATVNPEYTPDQRGQILRDLKLVGGEGLPGSVKTHRDKVQYWAHVSKDMPVFFGATAEN
ncbi:hypothetical protein [Nitratidesulfovibrio sp.]|uniref:hypothetical protein n=1 Tax=Nitratidesulfovibrio sp. TaxID=2802297 RepID=UPI003340B7BD